MERKHLRDELDDGGLEPSPGQSSAAVTARSPRRNLLARAEGAAGEGFHVRCVRRRASLYAMREEWEKLFEASRASVFCSWEWLCAWLERLGGDREAWVLVARDSTGGLRGLLPLSRERRRVFGRSVHRLSFLGDSHVGSDYLDVICTPEDAKRVTAAFSEWLLFARAHWDVLDLLDVDAQAPTAQWLQQGLGGAGLVGETRARFVCPFESLRPEEGFDAFLGRTGRKDNYLRRRRWLERQSGFRIEQTRSPKALLRPLGEFFRLHRLRWAEEGGSQGIRGPDVEAFHRDATLALAERGKVRLYTLWLGEVAVASVYALVHQGTFLYYQAGYDPAWRSKSVGLVLVGETFKDALDARCHTYDFLRGTESYKSDWVHAQRHTVALRFYAPRGPGASFSWAERASTRLRTDVKAVLPEPWVEAVRRWRRQRA